MLVQRGQRAMAAERARHGERAGHVHIGRDQREAGPVGAGVEEAERPLDVDLVARIERRALRTDQHVLEIEFDVGFDAHGKSGELGKRARRGPTDILRAAKTVKGAPERPAGVLKPFYTGA